MNNDLVEKSQKNIKNSLQRVAKKQFKDSADEQNKFVTETFSRIKGSSNLNEVVKSTDLVIEAIIESIKIKHDLFAAIDKVSKCVERKSIQDRLLPMALWSGHRLITSYI